MSTSTQNNGSEITADSIKTRLENIRDDSLPKLVENITNLITRYKELQYKLKKQTEDIQNLNKDNERVSHAIIIKEKELSEQNKKYDKDIKHLFEHVATNITKNKKKWENENKDIEFIQTTIDRILHEKDAKIRSLSNKIIEITTTQQLLESQRNETIEEMNKTASSIIGQLEHISGSIKAADGSSGGKMKTRKLLKSRRNHKKTRAKKRK